ncbi:MULTISPECIES: hypothetical protein [unclassified Microbacterium]|uniref:hypothetical protein n=1 Tax=Microbacterium TaxID=33882 RepID=UPI003B9DCE94
MDSDAPEHEQHRLDLDAASAEQIDDPWSARRRLAWGLAWSIPVVALVVGIVLTSSGTLEFTRTYDGYTYEAEHHTVWPAGLALLATGVLGLTAAAIATALMLTPRPALDSR